MGAEPWAVLSYPRAIPDEYWLKQSLLWMDRVEVMWPSYGIDPRDKYEKFRVDECEKAIDSGLMYCHSVYYRDMEAVEEALRDYQPETLPALPEGTLSDQVEEPERFLFRNKMSPDVEVELLRRGWARPAGQYRQQGVICDAQFVGRLVHAAAEQKADDTGATLRPDNPVSGYNALIPAADDAMSAVAISLEVLPRIEPGALSIGEILDLRAKSRFERARRDYVAEIRKAQAELQSKIEHRLTDEERLALLSERAQRDLDAARIGLFTRIVGSPEVASIDPERLTTVANATIEVANLNGFSAAVPAAALATSVAWGLRSRPRRVKVLHRIDRMLGSHLIAPPQA